MDEFVTSDREVGRLLRHLHSRSTEFITELRSACDDIIEDRINAIIMDKSQWPIWSRPHGPYRRSNYSHAWDQRGRPLCGRLGSMSHHGLARLKLHSRTSKRNQCRVCLKRVAKLEAERVVER